MPITWVYLARWCQQMSVLSQLGMLSFVNKHTQLMPHLFTNALNHHCRCRLWMTYIDRMPQGLYPNNSISTNHNGSPTLCRPLQPYSQFHSTSLACFFASVRTPSNTAQNLWTVCQTSWSISCRRSYNLGFLRCPAGV